MKTFVTGASRGIGLAICRELARQGHDLLMVAKNPDILKKSAAAVQAIGKTKVSFLPADLTNPNSLKAIRTFVQKNKKGLCNLVLNAGIALEGGLKSGSRKIFEKQMELHLYSVFGLVQTLLPYLDHTQPCRIVITGSSAGLEASHVVPMYSVTKWALRGYAVNLRNELKKDGVAVTYMAPGATYTDIWKYRGGPKPERLIAPEDIAKMVAAILSLSGRCDVEEVLIRPMLGELH
jgi:short-subunit dehydrogenase